MKPFTTTLAVLALCSVATPGMTIESDGGSFVLTWDAVEGDYEYLVLAFSTEEYDDTGLGWGSHALRMDPDQETGGFPTEAVVADRFYIDRSKCIGCGLCIPECAVDAIELVDGKAVIDPDKCILCGLCSSSCPTGAIITPSESDHYALLGVNREGETILIEEL